VGSTTKTVCWPQVFEQDRRPIFFREFSQQPRQSRRIRVDIQVVPRATSASKWGCEDRRFRRSLRTPRRRPPIDRPYTECVVSLPRSWKDGEGDRPTAIGDGGIVRRCAGAGLDHALADGYEVMFIEDAVGERQGEPSVAVLGSLTPAPSRTRAMALMVEWLSEFSIAAGGGGARTLCSVPGRVGGARQSTRAVEV